jgi:hypothetical protein
MINQCPGTRWRSGREPLRRLALVLATVLLLWPTLACSSGSPAGLQRTSASPRLPIPATPSTAFLYVSPDGDDDAAGTRDAPLQTIETAASRATPGTTVVVADGTYEGPIQTSAAGTPGARISYVSENRWGARIVGEAEGEPVWQSDGDHVDIVGFDITGDTADGLLITGSYVRVVGNHVHDFADDSCIFTYSSGYALHDVDIIGNVVDNCGLDSKGHGIYTGHTAGVVSNNISYGHRGYGIHCWHNCNSLTISNNVVFDNGEGGIIIGQGDNPNFGKVAADDFVVANNIAVRNGGAGIEEYGATGPNNAFLHNIVFDNETSGIDLQSGEEFGTINSDPEFVDLRPDPAGDYRLSSGSPGVDAGTPVGAPSTDFAGEPRPQGSGVDIGVYER